MTEGEMIRDTREISRAEFRRLKRQEANLEALAFTLLGFVVIGCGYALLYIMAVTGPWT